MRALTFHGSHDVRIDRVAEPRLQEPDDLLLRVTATAICGSDLHLYRGKIPMVEQGDILGHEFMGVVEEVGSAVTAVRPGDRVVVPFVIACGECFFCRLNLHAACETTNLARRDPQQEADSAGRGALWLQPPVRRRAGWPGRIRSRPRPTAGLS